MQIVLLGGAVAAWAALHSWLASNRMKTWAARILGASASWAYRLAYNIGSVISLAPIAWLMWRLPDRQLYSVPPPWGLIMMGIQGLAASLAALTLLRTDAMHFAGLSQILRRPASSRLLQNGTYAVVRHPLYLFGLVFLWLSPRMSVNQMVLTTVWTAYFYIGALLEERRLVQEFGEAYEAYRSRTPMIIPRVRLP